MHIHSPYRQKTAYIYIFYLKEFWLVCTNSMISPIIVILPKYTKNLFSIFSILMAGKCTGTCRSSLSPYKNRSLQQILFKKEIAGMEYWHFPKCSTDIFDDIRFVTAMWVLRDYFSIKVFIFIKVFTIWLPQSFAYFFPFAVWFRQILLLQKDIIFFANDRCHGEVSTVCLCGGSGWYGEAVARPYDAVI